MGNRSRMRRALRRAGMAGSLVAAVAALTAVFGGGAQAAPAAFPSVPAFAAAAPSGSPIAFVSARGTAKRARTNTTRARKLVRSLVRAKSDRARLRAAMAIMRALRVAVYSGKGKALTKRASVARSVYLYEFEVRILAQRLAAGERVPLAEVADMLGKAGLEGPDGKLSRTSLANGLRKTIAEMTRRPRARDGLGAFVLRELGRQGKKRFDPARQSAVRRGLDPLQHQLLLTALSQYATVRARSKARASAAAPVARASVDCGDIQDARDAPFNGGLDGLGGAAVQKVTEDSWGRIVRKEILSKSENRRIYRKLFRSRIGKLVTKAANKLNPLKQVAHIALLDSLIDVRETEQFVGPVHLNHERTRPNAVILRTQVRMLADLPKELVSCGQLAGFEVPAKGGVPDVPITWAHPRLPDLGRVDCPEAGCMKTDANGIATLRVELNEERFPGYGREVRETGTAHSVAHVHTAFGSLLDAGQLVEIIKPKSGTHAWGVSYHEDPELVLRFTSRLDQRDDVGGDRSGTSEGHYAVRSELPVAIGSGASGPIVWDRFSFAKRNGEELCTADGSTVYEDEDGIAAHPGTLHVQRLTYDQFAVDAGVELDFRFDPPPAETYEERDRPEPSSVCPPASGSSRSSVWAGWFYGAVRGTPGGSLQDMNGYAFRLTGWERGGGPVGGEGVIARKVVDDGEGSALLELVGRPRR